MNDLAAMKGKVFVASYSGGKDSVLAVHRAIEAGLAPLELITTYNTDIGRSWFHGLPREVLDSVARSTGIPVRLIRTLGEDYTANFETALREAAAKGAQVCVFGDIDIQGHRDWCTARCRAAGLEAVFPLWRQSRKALVYGFIAEGFGAVLTTVDKSRLPADFLGKPLTEETARRIEEAGADICGENGEYHTFVHSGPLFRERVDFSLGEAVGAGRYLSLPIAAGK